MDVTDEINTICCNIIISYDKRDFNEFDNRHMDIDEEHHEYYVHDWCTVLIGFNTEIRGNKNHKYRWVAIIEEIFFKGQSHKKENIDESNNDNEPKSDDNKVEITVKWIQYLQEISNKGSDHVWDSWWVFMGIWITVSNLLEYFSTSVIIYGFIWLYVSLFLSWFYSRKSQMNDLTNLTK